MAETPKVPPTPLDSDIARPPRSTSIRGEVKNKNGIANRSTPPLRLDKTDNAPKVNVGNEVTKIIRPPTPVPIPEIKKTTLTSKIFGSKLTQQTNKLAALNPTAIPAGANRTETLAQFAAKSNKALEHSVSRMLVAQVAAAQDNAMTGATTNAILMNIMNYNKSTDITYKTKHLALSYQQVYASKEIANLLTTLNSVIDSKLEAIKMNTAAPEANKRGIMDVARDVVTRNTVTKITGKIDDFIQDKFGATIDRVVKNPLLELGRRYSKSNILGAKTFRKVSNATIGEEGLGAVADKFWEKIYRVIDRTDHSKIEDKIADKVSKVADGAKEAVSTIQNRVSKRNTNRGGGYSRFDKTATRISSRANKTNTSSTNATSNDFEGLSEQLRQLTGYFEDVVKSGASTVRSKVDNARLQTRLGSMKARDRLGQTYIGKQGEDLLNIVSKAGIGSVGKNTKEALKGIDKAKLNFYKTLLSKELGVRIDDVKLAAMLANENIRHYISTRGIKGLKDDLLIQGDLAKLGIKTKALDLKNKIMGNQKVAEVVNSVSDQVTKVRGAVTTGYQDAIGKSDKLTQLNSRFLTGVGNLQLQAQLGKQELNSLVEEKGVGGLKQEALNQIFSLQDKGKQNLKTTQSEVSTSFRDGKTQLESALKKVFGDKGVSFKNEDVTKFTRALMESETVSGVKNTIGKIKSYVQKSTPEDGKAYLSDVYKNVKPYQDGYNVTQVYGAQNPYNLNRRQLNANDAASSREMSKKALDAYAETKRDDSKQSDIYKRMSEWMEMDESRGHEMLSVLNTIAAGSGDGSGSAKKPGFLRRGFGKGFGALKWLTKKSFGMQLGAVKMGLGLFTGNRSQRFVDIYRKDRLHTGHPLLTRKKLEEGVCFENGKRVKDLSHINQPVLDIVTGQVLITSEDIDAGLVDVFGKPITRRKIGSSSALGGLFGAVGRIGAAAFSRKNPLWGLYGMIFKAMSTSITSITSAFMKGAFGLTTAVAKGGFKLAGKVAGPLADIYKSMFVGGGKMLGGLFGGIFGKLFGGNKTSANKKDLEDVVGKRLEKIYTFLQKNVSSGRKTSGDSDGDGIRDNSYQDMLRKSKQKVKERLRPNKASGDKKVAELPDFGLGSVIKSLFGGLSDLLIKKVGGGIFKALSAGFSKLGGGMINLIKGGLGLGAGAAATTATTMAATSVATSAAAGAATTVAGAAAKTAATEAAEVTAKQGLLRTAGKSLLKKLPGVGIVAGGVFAAQRAMAGDWTGAGLEMVSGLVSTVPGFGTMASVAIDAGLAVRDLTNDPKAQAAENAHKDFLKFRMDAYGVESDRNYPIVLKFEREVFDIITKKKAQLTPDDYKDIAVKFGINKSNPKDVEYFATWFNQRFVRLFMILNEKGLKALNKTYETLSGCSAEEVKKIRDLIKPDFDKLKTQLRHLKPDNGKLDELKKLADEKTKDDAKQQTSSNTQQASDAKKAEEQKADAARKAADKINDDIEKADKRSVAKQPVTNTSSGSDKTNDDIEKAGKRADKLKTDTQPPPQAPKPPSFMKVQTLSKPSPVRPASANQNNQNTPSLTLASMRSNNAGPTALMNASFVTPNNDNIPGRRKLTTVAGMDASTKPMTQPTMVDGSGKIGQLSSKYESRGDSSAIGYDSTGGTSYGKYQIASKPGTFNAFLAYARSQGPTGKYVADNLQKAGDPNTGAKNGAVPDVWRKLAKEGVLGDLEHGFIKATHYDKAFAKLDKDVQNTVNGSSALQEVLWSSAVQAPGLAIKTFNTAWKDSGGDKEAFVKKIYEKRANQFGSSTPEIRASVQKRLVKEQSDALSLLAKDSAPSDTMMASNSSAATIQPAVMQDTGTPKTPSQMIAASSGVNPSAPNTQQYVQAAATINTPPQNNNQVVAPSKSAAATPQSQAPQPPPMMQQAKADPTNGQMLEQLKMITQALGQGNSLTEKLIGTQGDLKTAFVEGTSKTAGPTIVNTNNVASRSSDMNSLDFSVAKANPDMFRVA